MIIITRINNVTIYRCFLINYLDINGANLNKNGKTMEINSRLYIWSKKKSRLYIIKKKNSQRERKHRSGIVIN